MQQKAGTVATLAIIGAILSYVLTFTGHPFFGFLSALIAIILGIIGVIMAASPRVGGGLLSIIAIILGGIAIAIAVLGMIGVIIF